jgi:lysophospholipase
VRNPRKGHVRAFADYRLDLDAVRDKVLIPHMPRPHFALAHSMGAAVALNEAAEGRLPFERLVASTPMIGLSMVKRPKVVARVALAMNLLGFGRSFVPGGGETSIATKPFPGNRLTSDPVRYARNAASAYAVGAGAVGEPTVSWLHGAFKLMARLADPRLPLRIRLPTLILAAGADPVCDTRVTERFAARLKAGHAIVFPGARHEVMMERDAIRELFWAAFDAFVPGSSGLKEAPAVGEYAGVDATEEADDRVQPPGPWPSPLEAQRLSSSTAAACTRRSPAATIEPPFAAGAPVPGRHDAAGSLDDRDQRHDVVGLEAGLDHEIDMAGGQHAIGVAIAAVARQAGDALDPVVGPERLAGEEPRARRGHDGVFEGGAGAHSETPLAPRAAERGAPGVAEEALAREGLVHHPEGRNAAPVEADQRAPGGKPRDEGAGAVDGVEHPHIFRILALGAELLAHDPMGREGALDELAHGGLARPVGFRDGVEGAAARFVVGRDGGAEEGEDGLAGERGELMDELGEVDERHGSPGRAAHAAGMRF